MLQDVTKVVLGAASMTSNGNVVSRVGTAMIASVANAYKKPVIICCETYKVSSATGVEREAKTHLCPPQFCDRVQIDAITTNELAPPSELAGDAPSPESSIISEISESPIPPKTAVAASSAPLAGWQKIDR